MRRLINLLALFILVSVNVFTPVSYAQLDDLQVSVPETVDQNVLPEINEEGGVDNENQNVDEILEDKVGKTTNFDDYNGGEESEKDDDEKNLVEDIPEVSDNMGGLVIDLVEDVVDEYSEAEETEVEESEAEESEVEKPEVEDVVFNKNLLNLVEESVLSVSDSQIVQDLELYFVGYNGGVSHYTIMDRNLGASGIYNQNWEHQNEESYGYYYKWGNNQGFTASDSAFLSASTGTWVEGEQGPCPDGYYIPSVHDWSNLRTKWSESRIHNSNELFRVDFAYDLLLPPAGRKDGSSAAEVGQGGIYRTSSPNAENSAYVLYFYKGDSTYNYPLPDRSRSIGANLRCFKNDFQSGGNLNFHLNGGERGVVTVNDGKFTSMSNPYRLVSIFEGWYTTPDFQPGTKLGVGSGTDGVTDLYAKWGCFEGYVLSGNACVGGTIVRFDSKCWVSQPSITVPYGTVLDFSGEVVKYPDGTTVTITGVSIACPGETFAGWGTGNNYQRPKRTIKTIVIPDGENNITLHAIYRSNLNITFNATKNGGETDTDSISVPYGTLIDLSNYTGNKGSGGVRTFLGRNTDPYATGVFSNMYKAENEDSDYTTLYAIFRKDKFNVNFETNGHGTTPATQVINRGEKVSNPGNLTVPGYTFEGWSDNEYLTTNFDFGIKPTDDVTLYAKWRAPGAKCYEGFEYDDNLRMCIKKNEWVIRVGLGGGIILSSGYSDFLEDLVSLFITGDYQSRMGDFDIAKNYYGIMLAENNDFDVYSNGSLNTEGQIVKVFEGKHDEGDLLFTMVTKASCRGDEPNCKFYNQNIEVAEGIPEWYNIKLFIPEDLKQQFVGSLTGVVRADNIRIIFDPRVVVTFDSNGHGVPPERQILNKGSRIINPGSLSAVGYKFLGWSDDEYLTSIFDFNTVVNEDIKLYAKWKPIGDIYNCPEGQEYDNSVGLCKKPKDWVIRIGYDGEMEFSSGYSLFLDEVLLKDLDLGMIESEVEAFKKAFGILMAVSETFDGTDEIVIDEAGVVADGDFWLLNYYNKDGKLLFTVVVDMAGTENNSSGWSIHLIIHTRSTYVNVASNVSSLDNLKLVPSSTGINEYVEAYPPIAQLENLWIIFSDRMEPNIIDNSGTHYSGGGGRNKSDTNDEHFSAESQDNSPDTNTNNSSQQQTYTDEFQQAYDFARKNNITTMDTIEDAKVDKKITRIEMAKMLSQYAINVLGEMPDITRYNKFADVSDGLDAEYNDAVSLAYQLGIMGINMPNNKFRPSDYITRAEFATALSRMLYGTVDGKPNYYSTHFEKLKSEGIMTILDPNMLEIRGYVMLMLMRSVK